MSLVTISTSAGDIHLELDAVCAPITVANFLTLAKDGYYNGTIFHRIIDGFMIQGGGLDETWLQSHRELSRFKMKQTMA